jgi:probable HAF family extracellular repeat protein
MNSKTWTRIIAVTLFASQALPLQLAAQAPAQPHHRYHHYQLVDPGTFGGPSSGLQNPQLPRAGVVNNRGTLTGFANTPGSDYPYCGFGNCYAGDAFQLRDGVTTDLGRLSGGFDSQVNWISASGAMTGAGDNGQPDPLAGFLITQIHALLWNHGTMTDLGTLPGGYNSFSMGVNNRGEVVGSAQNTVPDPNTMQFPGYGTQSRAFYWKDGVMQDLGTLGTGTDAIAALINDRGQVVGWSYVNSVPSPFCSGLNFALTTGTFIWDKKNGMKDIGGLGGTCTIAWDLNNRGRVVGETSRPGDPTNLAFVWDRATGMKELSTLGAGGAFAVNDAGEIVGYGLAPDGNYGAILWRKRERKWQTTYLGVLHSGDDFAAAWSINASAQVVGNSGPNGGVTTLPFLWEDGGPMVDLNTLLPPNSGIVLVEAAQINDHGEIAAQGPDANGNNHAVLLIPCDENHPDVEGCDYDTIDAETARRTVRPHVPNATKRLPHPRWSDRYRVPGQRLVIR